MKKVPAVILVHEWMGLGDHVKERADRIAKELGLNAFAADIYGKGVRPKDAAEAGATAGTYKNDRALMRKRILAAIEEVKKLPHVDSSKIAVIGYCFGGTVAIESALTGADLKGIVSFHGGLASPNLTDAQNIKGKVLVLNGGDDPFVKKEEVDTFVDSMKKGKVDYQFVAFANTVHSFTNKAAGNDNSKGAAYNEQSDKRSWEEMKDFFNEIFELKTMK
ncbi:MAG: dienelactone hydrolase family protein [Bacteriovoracaceae bacterium]